MSGFENARAHLVENYFAPVPSQFTIMPRAKERTSEAFSVLGYARALADDCLAITGNIDGSRTQ